MSWWMWFLDWAIWLPAIIVALSNIPWRRIYRGIQTRAQRRAENRRRMRLSDELKVELVGLERELEGFDLQIGLAETDLESDKTADCPEWVKTQATEIIDDCIQLSSHARGNFMRANELLNEDPDLAKRYAEEARRDVNEIEENLRELNLLYDEASRTEDRGEP